MDLKKILELLGADKLDESTQETLTEKLQSVVEIEAKKLSEATLEEKKNELIEQYEEKFETYKEDITSKFSNFVDTVLDEELEIPEKVLEYAKKGELYHDLIEQFKVRLGVDEGLLDEEIKSLLKEAKAEIIKMREANDQLTSKNLEVISDAQELAAEVYLHEKCKGLTESQKTQVFDILSGLTDKAEIDRKFDIIAESERFDPVEIGNDEGEKAIKKKKKEGDPKEHEDEVMEGADEDGKGKSEVEDEDEDDEDEDGKKKKKKEEMDESKSPFKQYISQYVKVLKENKI